VTTAPRFAVYLRVSTTDKQDPALSFPSQRKACERKAAEMGGAIVAEFTDQESGAKADRPGWTALTHEARDRDGRRFDAVVIYGTSRLARDRFLAALYDRELRKVDVAIHYATGAGDSSTPEGQLMIGMQQLWDEFERTKLARETKRGMREAAEQGFRTGGRAPYGYRRIEEPLPASHRGDRTKCRVTLEPEPEEAAAVAEIFHLYAHEGRTLKALANHMNRADGPPSPRHVDSTRNLRGHWAASTIRSILANPTYLGHTVWNRLDFASARQNGGGARRRAREEWTVTEGTHLPLVSADTYAAVQDRLASRQRGPSEHSRATYLFAGRVRCGTGHQPLSMHGKARKGHHYYACSYGNSYGDDAALETHAGQKWIYLREDYLLKLVERFLAQRIFGPMRLERLSKQLRDHRRESRRDSKLGATKVRQQLADTDRRLKVQVQALEDGIEPDLVSARIQELRDHHGALTAALADLAPAEAQDAEDEVLAERLDRIPDLTRAFRDAPFEVKRQMLDAFDVQIAYDKVEGRIEVSATISEAVADALENEKALREEGFQVTANCIAGAGFEPATFGL
jgi:site-specific DNA recombinase